MEEINWLMQEQELSSNCTKTEDPPADQTLELTRNNIFTLICQIKMEEEKGKLLKYKFIKASENTYTH